MGSKVSVGYLTARLIDRQRRSVFRETWNGPGSEPNA